MILLDLFNDFALVRSCAYPQKNRKEGRAEGRKEGREQWRNHERTEREGGRDPHEYRIWKENDCCCLHHHHHNLPANTS